MHGKRPLLGIVLTLSAACGANEPPEGTDMDGGASEDPQPCRSGLFVGRVGPGDTCIDHGPWQAQPVGSVGILAEFCEYTWSGGDPPDLSQLPGESDGVFGLIESCPLVIPQGDANAADGALRASLYEAYMTTVGKIPLAALTDEPFKQAIWLTFVDTIPATLIPTGETPNDPHGRTLEQLAEGLLCDAPGPCPVEVRQSLGLPRITPDRTDHVRGGMLGNFTDLAIGIDEAVHGWEQHGHTRPILALAVGWEPLGAYGPELAGKSLDTLLAPGGAAADVQVVLASLTRAACHDAWIVAAVGNATSEPCTQTGAVGPGFLQNLPAPTIAQCEAAGFPHAPVLTDKVPFLLTAGHVDLDGGTPGNARVAAPASFTAQGTAPGAPTGDDPILTGSSLAVVGLTSALAAVTAVCPERARAEVLERLRNDDPSGINVCRAVRDVCDDHAAAAALECPEDDEAAMVAVSAAIADKLAAGTNFVQLGADYPDSNTLSDNACGTPTTVWPSVGELPPFDPTTPWTKPTPIKDICWGCGVKIQLNPPKITVGLTLPAVPVSYPLLIEVQTSKGIERYALDPSLLIAGANTVDILPRDMWPDVLQVRLLVPTRGNDGEWYMRGEPLVRSYSAHNEDDSAWSPGPATKGEKVVQVALGSMHACAVLSGGAVKCWGNNDWGQLGLGHTMAIGDEPDEMGSHLPAVDLGDGETVKFIATGGFHTCALLDSNTLKCWGMNSSGCLGLGDAEDRGDEPGEMGTSLPTVDVESSMPTIALSAGIYSTCALLADGAIKCWGRNDRGNLGLGDANDRGDEPMEMGQNLAIVDLGDNTTASMLSGGRAHNCALAIGNAVKCWGAIHALGIGVGDNGDIGDESGEMGKALNAVIFGNDFSPTSVHAGDLHTCSASAEGHVRCWGRGGDGRLGLGGIQDVGAVKGQNVLVNTDLGEEVFVVKVYAGLNHTCALTASSGVKCWGGNSGGTLGLGDTESRGDQPGEMGPNLPAVELDHEVAQLAVAKGGAFNCVLLKDSSVKCWGDNSYGQLGLGDAQDRGDNLGEMGVHLPRVRLFSDER